jgi:hypothetical protein
MTIAREFVPQWPSNPIRSMKPARISDVVLPPRPRTPELERLSPWGYHDRRAEKNRRQV